MRVNTSGGRGGPTDDAALAAYDDLAVLTEALLLVQRHYVEEVPLQKMIYGAIDGMLLGLDPNSSFLPLRSRWPNWKRRRAARSAELV